MLILIVLLPLMGFISGSLLKRLIGYGSCIIATSIIFGFLLNCKLGYNRSILL